MKKRLLSLLLVTAMMLSMIAFASCDNGSKPGGQGTEGGTGDKLTPSGTEGNDTPSTGDTPGGDDDAPETNAYGLLREYFEDYVPDESAKYTGKAGFSATNASFDDIRLVKGSNTNMFEQDFESSQDIPDGLYTAIGGAISDWSVTEADGNHALTSSNADSILTIGNAKWGPYRVITKANLAEGGEARVYFCVADESNYYYVAVTETTSTLHQVSGGTDTVMNTLAIATPANEWITVSVNVDRTEIYVYVAGQHLFLVSEDVTPHTYSGLIGIGQWNTEFYIDNIKVEDPNTGEVFYSQDFEDGTFMDTVVFGQRNGGTWANPDNSAGDWEVIEVDGNHVLHYKNSGSYGAAILFDPGLPENCTSYKFTYEGYKVGGSEGFPCVWDWNASTVDASNVCQNYTCFNLGGWSGQAGFQTIVGGVKTNIQNYADVGLQTGVWQTVELYMYPTCVYAFFHGDFIQVLWY